MTIQTQISTAHAHIQSAREAVQRATDEAGGQLLGDGLKFVGIDLDDAERRLLRCLSMSRAMPDDGKPAA